jgi:hypothetical protein
MTSFHRVRLACVILGLAALASGCKRASPAQAVDPDQGREALRTTLTAWKNGQSAEALRQQSPAISVSDPKWQSGHRLIRYEIAENGEVVGFDLHCRVLLVLQSPSGSQIEEKALFCVSTAPALVVVRADN